MAGGGCHDRQHDGRVEEADLSAATDIGIEAAAMDVVEAEQVGEETGVEFCRFQHAGDVLVAGRVDDVVKRGIPGGASRRYGGPSGRF